MDLYERARSMPGEAGITGLPVDGDWVKVQEYRAKRDGVSCIVYVMRMPAQFWKLEVPAWSVELTTGSGMSDIVDALATAIQTGMIGIRFQLAEANPSGKML